jgi:hypothetical protein
MTDARKVIDLSGVDANYVTYKYDSTIVFDATLTGRAAQVGLAVAFKGQGTVGLTQDGDQIAGRLTLVEDDAFCNVQTEGYCQLPLGASATATAGKKAVGALGASSARGYIRDATTGDELKAEAQIVDSTTTTAVWVKLG